MSQVESPAGRAARRASGRRRGQVRGRCVGCPCQVRRACLPVTAVVRQAQARARRRHQPAQRSPQHHPPTVIDTWAYNTHPSLAPYRCHRLCCQHALFRPSACARPCRQPAASLSRTRSTPDTLHDTSPRPETSRRPNRRFVKHASILNHGSLVAVLAPSHLRLRLLPSYSLALLSPGSAYIPPPHFRQPTCSALHRRTSTSTPPQPLHVLIITPTAASSPQRHAGQQPPAKSFLLPKWSKTSTSDMYTPASRRSGRRND